MISSQGGPFLFGELKGTSWHRRFAAEEFQIFLDHYPKRKIVIDRELAGIEPGSNGGMEPYHSQLIDYFLNNRELDGKMPVEILKDLRRMRYDLFGLSPSGNRDCMPRLYEQSPLPFRKKLEEKLAQADRVLFFPGKPGLFEEDLTLLSQLTDGEIHVVCMEDPFLRGVTEKMFDRFRSRNRSLRLKLNSSFDLPLYSRGIEELKKLQDSGFTVFTTNLWLYLEIFRELAGFGFILNNYEWYSRGLLQSSFDMGGENLADFHKSPYVDLHRIIGNDKGTSLAGFQRRQFPSDIDVSGVQYNALSLSAFLKGESPKTLTHAMNERTEEFNKGTDKISVSSALYRIEPSGINVTEQEDSEAVLVSLLTVHEKDINAAPIFLNACASPEALNMSETGALVSFNYYFTENLVNYYNSRVPEKEKLRVKNFFIDHLTALVNGEKFETLPLYGKALLGCTKKGKIFAGHFRVEKVDLLIDNRSFSFSGDSINPRGHGIEEGLYLPSSNRRSVGEGRYCVVTVQDQIVYRGEGPCFIPPVGSVAVFREPVEGEDRFVRFRVSWKDLPYRSDELEWMVGGFNLLVKNGRSGYSTLTEAEQSLSDEGWSSEASGETQETQLDPAVRQPRAVFGRTASGRLLLAQFSGRTDISRGATFGETVQFIENVIGDEEELDFLINFDGGASASLIGHKDGRYSNFSLTAPSETNPAGVVRRLPAYFSLTLKTEKETENESRHCN